MLLSRGVLDLLGLLPLFPVLGLDLVGVQYSLLVPLPPIPTLPLLPTLVLPLLLGVTSRSSAALPAKGGRDNNSGCSAFLPPLPTLQSQGGGQQLWMLRT